MRFVDKYDEKGEELCAWDECSGVARGCSHCLAITRALRAAHKEGRIAEATLLADNLERQELSGPAYFMMRDVIVKLIREHIELLRKEG